MKNKKTKKKVKTAPEKKNLSITNLGDLIIIKNKSTLASALSLALLFTITLICMFAMRGAWNLPFFWIMVGLLMFGIVYSFLNVLFGKIILDSPNLTMTVYSPIKKTYKFEDINYIDQKSNKTKDGVVIYKVCVYIGNGRKSVEITSFSSEQADEIAELLRGMLDHGSIEYPEGNEEPFKLDEGKKDKKRLSLPIFTKKEKTPDTPTQTPSKEEAKEEKAVSEPKGEESEEKPSKEEKTEKDSQEEKESERQDE